VSVIGLAATLLPVNALAQKDPFTGGNWTVPACEMFEPSPNCEGLWATQAEVAIPPTGIKAGTRDPRCGSEAVQEASNYIPEMTRAAIAYYSGDKENLYKAAGSLSKAIFNSSMEEARKHIRGDVGRAIERNFGRKTDKAACKLIDIVLPEGAEVVGYRFVRVFGRNYITCSKSHVSPERVPTADCSFARFDYEPRKRTENGLAIFYTTFASWSHDQTGYGRMIMFYKMPNNERPLVLEGM
jgi:hypothetical protein